MYNSIRFVLCIKINEKLTWEIYIFLLFTSQHSIEPTFFYRSSRICHFFRNWMALKPFSCSLAHTRYIWTFNLLVLNNILYFLSDPSALVSWLTWVWHEFATYSLGSLYKNLCLMSRVWVLCVRYHQWWYPSAVPSVCLHLNHTFSLSTFIGVVVVVVSFELHFKQNMTITIFTLALIKNSIRYRTIQHYLPSYLYINLCIYTIIIVIYLIVYVCFMCLSELLHVIVYL